MSGFRTDQGGLYIISSPSDVLDYTLDWSNVLASSDSITNSAWSAPSPIVVGATSYASNTATAFLSGGVDATDYTIVNTITTSRGRTFARSFQLRIHAGI